MHKNDAFTHLYVRITKDGAWDNLKAVVQLFKQRNRFVSNFLNDLSKIVQAYMSKSTRVVKEAI